MSDSALTLLKRCKRFKSHSYIESLFWPVLYPLRTDPVRVEIILNCDTGLKISPTIGVHLGSPRVLEEKKLS